MTSIGSLRSVIPSALALLATYATASGQCMYWDAAGIPVGGSPFTHEMTVYDLGAGPKLFATYDAGVAIWMQTGWGGLFDTFDDAPQALCGYDDGTGTALYVAGPFTSFYWTGVPIWHIARYSATQSLSVGGGLPTNDLYPWINRMVVFDDGTGPQLYVGGGFSTPSSLNSNNIVRWDGTTWSGVGGGLPYGVGTLAVYDDGGGPALFASTSVSLAGGAVVGTLAKWNGVTWTMVGTGITKNGQAGGVRSLVEFDDGTGPALFAGGYFDHAGGVPAICVAKWDGTNWSALSGVPLAVGNAVEALEVHDDGSGPALYEGSSVGAPAWLGVARWDITHWSTLGSGPLGSVYCLKSYAGGSGGPALYVGGNFSTVAGDLDSPGTARWYGGCTQPVDTMCFGDGSFAECPCANYGPVGSGCRNSASTSGARLSYSGTPNPDTLALLSLFEPSTASSVFIQSDALRSVQRFFGDGILCLGGQLRRMYVKSAVLGTAQAPQTGDLSITQRSAALGDPLPPGAVRYYQVWYRDNATYCTPAAFNISSGLRVVW